MSTVGTKNYNGQDWFWPHDFRHYLRDANARQRKLIHNGWLKIGVPVKKSGLKISDSYLEPKKNQLKKAWMIVRKVVAPKELGQPIPESTNEGFAVNEKMSPEQYHKYIQYVFDTQFKTPEEKIAKKRIIKKINVAQKKKGLPIFKEGFADKLTKKMKKHKGTKVKSKLKLKLKGRGVYQDYDGLKETTYQFKKLSTTQMDELDAALSRAGVKGTPDFNNKTWTIHKDPTGLRKRQLDYYIKSKGGKKIKEGDLGPTTKKGKTVKAVHTKSGKEIVVVDTPSSRKKLKRMGFKVEGSCGYGIDGKVGSQPAGPHLLKKKKKKVDEFMNKQMAGETLKQLGGRRFIAMTGAKNMAVGTDGMVMKIGRNSKGVNYVRIDLKGDLYTMEFIRMRSGKETVLKKVKGVYNDQLQDMFTKYTGMYTSL